MSVYVSVFDYGSGEATGPRWPRRPQASQVSELSIPRWLLHSCENRKAAPTTNTRGTGGKTANLWLINNRSFLSLQDLFPIFQNCWLNGNKVFHHSSAYFSPHFPPRLLVQCFESTCFLQSSGSSVCVCSSVFILQFLILDMFFFPLRRVWNSRQSGLGFVLCK